MDLISNIYTRWREPLIYKSPIFIVFPSTVLGTNQYINNLINKGGKQ